MLNQRAFVTELVARLSWDTGPLDLDLDLDVGDQVPRLCVRHPER